MTPEEALRGYTVWAAYASFRDSTAGTLAPGKWADLTVVDVDPLALAPSEYDRLLGGRILYTIVGGRVEYDRHAGGILDAAR
jgi:predicted amidohydrolase YtcJ